MSSTRKHGATSVPLLVDRLSQSYLASWRRTPDAPPTLGGTYTPHQQQANGEYCDEFLAEVENALGRYPTHLREQDNWRRRISILFRKFCKRCLGYSDELLQLLFTEQNLAATREFVRRARAFDENVEIDDLHQALRNVWVMNSIQFLLGREVRCSSSVFAYSMLYPYTDNYLDDSALTAQDKHAFNYWLEHRLKGTLSTPRNPRESSLCRLVSCIEGRSQSAHCHRGLRQLARYSLSAEREPNATIAETKLE